MQVQAGGEQSAGRDAHLHLASEEGPRLHRGQGRCPRGDEDTQSVKLLVSCSRWAPPSHLPGRKPAQGEGHTQGLLLTPCGMY